MREIRNINPVKKEINSKFFEYFKKYGSYGTTRATDAELSKNMNRLIKDLIYGNLNAQNIEQLKLDNRILYQLSIELVGLLDKQNLYLSLFNDAKVLKSISYANKLFQQYYEEENAKFRIYTCIYQNIIAFTNTMDENYLRNINAQCNTPLLNKYRVLI